MKWGEKQKELAEKLSPGAYAELVENFAGERITVPRAVETRRERAEHARKLLETETYREAARLLDCSVDTVQRDSKRCT